MDVETSIDSAWSKTVEDFKKAVISGDAWLWTEATFRLNFFRRLCETARLGRVLADTGYHIGDIDLKPDIVADVTIDGDSRTIAFEMKFFGKSETWKKDLERLSKYSLVGWDYGYFLAIGRPEECEEILKAPTEEEPDYRLKVLVYPTQPLTKPTYSKYAEFVLKKSLEKNVPYVINELYGAVAWYENCLLHFDMTAKENKIVVWALVDEKWVERSKLSQQDFTWVTFDEEGKMHLSESFTGRALIFEYNWGASVNEIVGGVREALSQFWKKSKAPNKS